MLVRGAAASIIILLTGSAAVAGEASPGDALAAPQTQGATQTPAAPGMLASSASASGPESFPVLSALPADYFATTPYLLGEWPGIRSKLGDLGIQASLTGVDEAVMNLSGGLRQNAQEAGQVALQAQFDLQKRLGLTGASILVTLVSRWGRNAAADAGIPALQLLNEVYGRGNILRLEELAWNQKLFDDRIEFTVGRLAFGDQFFSFPCDFINLTFCPGQAGNLVGDYIYVFAGRDGTPVGHGTITRALASVARTAGDIGVPHGWRAVFGDWCTELGGVAPDLAELALAHQVPVIFRTYHRGTAVEARRPVMQKYADWLLGIAEDNVLAFPKSA